MNALNNTVNKWKYSMYLKVASGNDFNFNLILSVSMFLSVCLSVFYTCVNLQQSQTA